MLILRIKAWSVGNEKTIIIALCVCIAVSVMACLQREQTQTSSMTPNRTTKEDIEREKDFFVNEQELLNQQIPELIEHFNDNKEIFNKTATEVLSYWNYGDNYRITKDDKDKYSEDVWEAIEKYSASLGDNWILINDKENVKPYVAFGVFSHISNDFPGGGQILIYYFEDNEPLGFGGMQNGQKIDECWFISTSVNSMLGI